MVRSVDVARRLEVSKPSVCHAVAALKKICRMAAWRWGWRKKGKTLLICTSRGEIACEITQDTPDILLSRLEAQNLLLAPTPFVDVSALPDCARRFFPLPVCIVAADGF